MPPYGSPQMPPFAPDCAARPTQAEQAWQTREQALQRLEEQQPDVLLGHILVEVGWAGAGGMCAHVNIMYT